MARSLDEVRQQYEWIQRCRPEARHRHLRQLAKTDLFFLGRYILGWDYADHPWQFARAREVQANPDGYLDLWARGHMKSHWITHALTIQDILNDPNVTICIFSFNRPAAKAHLRKIKMILESCELLRSLFPDIIWAKPGDGSKWSEDEGICVKRTAIKLEQTVEAWGLIDGQPVGRHFDKLVYDDVVTADLVTNSDMIADVTYKWEISQSLAQPMTRARYVGTFYHENDTYHAMIAREAVIVRRYPVFALNNDGTVDEEQPVFFTAEEVADKRKAQGPRNFAFQYLLDPGADPTKLRWRIEWLQRYGRDITTGVNVYIICDPANEQGTRSDYTTIGAIGCGADRNYYLLDLVRDRLNLKQRTDALFAMHMKFMRRGIGMKPQAVGYEKYGKDSDIAHIEEKMGEKNYHFPITPLAGRLSKKDRISRLQPTFEEKRWYLPMAIHRTDFEGNQVELVTTFINDEYVHWPEPKHDDILDMLARILDPKLNATFPIASYVGSTRDYPEVERQPATWMGF